MADLKRRLEELLEPFGQTHVLRFWERLSGAERLRLADEVQSLDLPLLMRAFQSGGQQSCWAELAARATGPPAVRLPLGWESQRREAWQRGEQALREGRVGMLLVAGGQGTRLGFPRPKGLLPLGPVSGRSLFCILVDRLRAVARRYGASIPLYLMTSPATHAETVEFLERHERFGLPAGDLRIFCQGTLPVLDAETGRLLLAAPDRLCSAPDGHGGMLAALVHSGCLRDAEQRGLEQLFYGQVDNPLTQVCEPGLIGEHLLAGSEMTTQVVRKREPLDSVGNVVSVDGRVRIIEYSDLPAEAAGRRTADGELELWAGNMAVHVFDVAFLTRVSGDPEALPLHRALKSSPYLDDAGRQVQPEGLNAWKFERFIFDLLPAARQALAVEAEAAEAFAPVKRGSAEARDTPETARAAMVAL
ncbi:MAG: UTP--glucose-1-phosphate uridylyltransferase, partial [Pirellulaceae bacterium]|nr:UTP--glucose-1-phosphate uridylyltransferase [Pirellulaceae bacterium]